MKSFFRFTFPFIFLFLFLSLFVSSQDKVTFCSLLDEMVDLERLTRFSEQEYQSVQFSSYDRRSVSPYEEGWFANSDGFGNEPIPGFEKVLKEPDGNGIGEYLICDIKKAGAIVRLWSARINGNIRLFIDNTDSPYFEGKAEDFFWNTPKVLTGEEFPDGVFRQFDAVYFPIPFEKRLRIEWIGDLRKLHFYHVGVKIYNDDVIVESFKREDAKICGEKLEMVVDKFQGKEIQDIHFSGNEIKILPASEIKTVWETKGEGAIESFDIKTESLNAEKFLRKCILNIFFDNSSVPQVQAPLGDFFGAAPGINAYNSLPFSVTNDGYMVSRFIMPFKKNVRIEVDNRSGFNFKLSLRVKTTDYNWEDGKSMHFRTRWRIDHNLTASNTRIVDMNYLTAVGKGRITGAATYVYNPSNVPTSNGNWWGEGDEKIFIDGDDIPSFFGTGSEDYYNYSWSSARIFSYPYCGQPRNDGPGNRGYAANFRWHILDDIPFYQSIAFYMELYHHGVVPKFSYGSIVYYYAIPGTIDDYQPISITDIQDLTYSSWTPESYRGSAGYRFLEAEDIVEKIPSVHMKEGKKWSGGIILMWQPKNTGDQLKFTFSNNSDAGETKIGLTMAKMPEGGEFSLRVNGEKVRIDGKTSISLFEEHQIGLDNFFTEPVHLKNGINELLFESNKKVFDKKIGVDFIWISK